MIQENYRVRAMTESDLSGAEQLFSSAYGQRMGPEHRRWFLRQNPFSQRIGQVAEARDGRLVGHVSYVPVPFRHDGRRVLGAFMVQAMIHPDFQKQGIFKALVAACETQHEANHIEVLQAFPNDNSVHAFTHTFQWDILDGPNYIYFRVLDWAAAIRGKIGSEVLARLAGTIIDPMARLSIERSTPACTIRQVERFDDRLDSLWERFSAAMPNAIDRTSGYVNWRVAESPGSYGMFVAEVGTTLVGALITKYESRFGLQVGYVVELVFDPKRPRVGRELLAHAVRMMRNEQCSVALAATAGSSLVRRTLYRGGFWHLPRRVMPHGIHFVYKVRTHTGPRRPPYFVSWLDHDLL